MHVEHPADLSRLDRIAAYYLMAVTFYTVIWSARISILFSIIRIDPDPRMRYRLKWLAAAFVAAVCGLLFQLFWTCEHLHGWKNKASPQCPLPKQVAIFQLISACAFAFFWDSPLLTGPPQVTFSLIWPSSYFPSASSAESRTGACDGVSFSSSPPPVSLGFSRRTKHKQTTEFFFPSSRDDDRVPRTRSVHHQPRRHPRDHLRARRGLHVAHSRQPPRRRDGLLPPYPQRPSGRRRRRPTLVHMEIQDAHYADDDQRRQQHDVLHHRSRRRQS
jgi:hypothetical protein